MTQPLFFIARPTKHQSPLLKWAQGRNYPQLVLSDGTIIRHGEPAWQQFRGKRNKRKMLLAWQRIQQWQKLEEQAS